MPLDSTYRFTYTPLKQTPTIECLWIFIFLRMRCHVLYDNTNFLETQKVVEPWLILNCVGNSTKMCYTMKYQRLGNSYRIEIVFPKTLVFFYMFQVSRELKEKHFWVQEGKAPAGRNVYSACYSPKDKAPAGRNVYQKKHCVMAWEALC